MKATISLYGYGHEFSIGTISQKIWDYIQEVYDGDFDEYLEGLGNGDVPEDRMHADDRFSMCDCDDLYHNYSGWLESCTIDIEDEDGNMLFSAKGDALEKAGVKVERCSEHVNENARYLAIFSSEEKGTFKTGEFEIDGEFDPQKLKVYCSKICFGDREDNYMVDTFEYGDQEIECDFDASNGKGSDIYMLDTQANEDEYDDEYDDEDDECNDEDDECDDASKVKPEIPALPKAKIAFNVAVFVIFAKSATLTALFRGVTSPQIQSPT